MNSKIIIEVEHEGELTQSMTIAAIREVLLQKEWEKAWKSYVHITIPERISIERPVLRDVSE